MAGQARETTAFCTRVLEGDTHLMIWRQRLGALFGILIALAMISGVVVWLFNRVEERTAWTEFVQESSRTVFDTAEMVEAAQETLTEAVVVSLDADLTTNLSEQIEQAEAAIAASEGLAQFVETEAEEMQNDPNNPWAGLDPLAALTGSSNDVVVYPSDGRVTVDYYHGIVADLEGALRELKEANETVVAALDSTLQGAREAWEVAVTELSDSTSRAFARLQELSAQPDDDFEDPNAYVGIEQMWEAFRSARAALETAQRVNQDSITALERSTATVQEETEQLNALFTQEVVDVDEAATQENEPATQEVVDGV